MNAFKNIIISRTDKIGDFVVSIPSYATAKAMYPQARIIALVSKNNWMIAKNIKCIDECMCIDHFKEQQNVGQYLADFNPDVFIALVSDNKISKIAKESGAPIRIGPYSKFWSFFHYNKGVRQRRSQCIKSEAEYNLDLVRSLDPQLFDKVGVQFDRIICTERERAIIGNFLLQEQISEAPVILFNPFTGGSGSNLSIEGYGQVINDILDEDKLRACAHELDMDTQELIYPHIVLMGIESQRQGCERIVDLIDENKRAYVHTFINHDSLLVAAAMVERAQVFIGPSTGITQIAGNYHKRAMCFYSTRKSNSHTRWALFGDPYEQPVTLKLEELDANTKELQHLTTELKEYIVSWVLKNIFNDI